MRVPLLKGLGRVGVETVAGSDNRMRFSLGAGVVSLDQWLILDGSQRVGRDVFAGQRKQLEHGAERDVNLLVLVLVVAMARLGGEADDGEAISVQQNGLAHGVMPGKKQLRAL